MRKKATYRIRNWNKYNKALIKRGSLTFWFDEEAIAAWYEEERTGRRGCPRTYSDVAIQCTLTLRGVYHLPLRGTQGLLESLLDLMGLELHAPDYTTLCRRQGGLEVSLPRQEQGKALHVVVDATGLKVYGEGEWKVRQHGYTKRRTWRKLHLGVDEGSGEVVATVLSTNNVGDSEVLADLLDQIDEPIEQLSADGSYDTWEIHADLQHRGIRAAIPPRKTARIRQRKNSHEPPLPRDEALRAIRKKGRALWKREAGYHRRSLVENAIFRLKKVFGDKLAARLFDHQATEAFLRCRALTRMTQLGMPESYPVAA